MKRSLALFVAAALVTLVGAGCGSSAPSSTLSDAATITYTVKGKTQTLHVSRDQLLSEVGSIVANKPFADYLNSNGFPVSKNLSADSKVTAIWLSQLISQQAIDTLYASRHAQVTSAIRTAAAKDVVQIFPGATIFPAFSKTFQSTLTERQARSEALVASYADTSDAAGQAYFRSHKSQFACASGKNVAHILVATQAAAQGIIDQLNGGASFATLAQQDSTDKQSGAQGGSLGCLAPNEFVAPFQTAADAAPFDKIVGPVHTQFGYHVILVTHAVTTYDSVRTQVASALRQQASQTAQAAIDALLKGFKVHLDARFGTWGLVKDSTGSSRYQVTAPVTSTPRTSRDSTTTAATTTSVPASTGTP
jgi:peptidyl-prolyl cis-trans isomerase C